MQALPNSELECDVPPGVRDQADLGKRLRTSRLPANGVAASRVSPSSRMPGMPRPSTLTGFPARASQNTHGALYQALSQVMNGCSAWIRQLSRRHRFQLVGHWTSVHWTAL